jgi:hypothetical protein
MLNLPTGPSWNPDEGQNGAIVKDSSWFDLGPLSLAVGGNPANPANNPDLPTLDNRANALAQAINKTGVQSLNNPCTVVGFYAASTLEAGIGLAGANARTIGTAAAEEYPSLFHRFLTWLNGLSPRGGTVSAAIAVAKAAPAQIQSTCSKLQ